MQTFHVYIAWAIFVLDLGLRLFFCYRVISRRLPVGVTWAWLSLILFLPFCGTVSYLYLGEYRLGRRRERRLKDAAAAMVNLVHRRFPQRDDELDLSEPSRSLALMARTLFDSPVLLGNDIELLAGAEVAFERMIADINQARVSCDMVFYIWSDGGRADAFGEALVRAVARGVRVRVLLDQIGSASFFSGRMARKLKDVGVDLRAALPSGIFRSLIARPDLRIHRKILVIDGALGFTGSLNLADPILFKRDAGVGQWVDALVRLKGPAVEALGLVFLSDWCVETELEFSKAKSSVQFHDIAEKKAARIQSLPSGPAGRESSIEQTLITSIYLARREVLLTTPYFVPSESMLYALTAAARRGVKVTLIVPAKVDSVLIQYASRAFISELIQCGVQVALYKPGLLHTKSVAVDGEFSLFGSLNMDPRSLRINFEITLAIYDRLFTQQLNQLQREYLKACEVLTLETCREQSHYFREDLARLGSPLL